MGLKAKANMPRPFRLSPWQKWQFWKKICPPSRTYCKNWGAFSSHGLPSMYFFWTISEYFPSSSTRYGLLAVWRTKVLPCTLVLAGGAGCTVRSSIGSSMLGFMLFQPRKPTRKGNSTTETARMILVVGVFASATAMRSEEHTSELQSRSDLVCRLLLEKKKITRSNSAPHSNQRAQHGAHTLDASASPPYIPSRIISSP